MTLNKLVRDKIPQIIKKKSKTPVTHIADDQEYWLKLKAKLIEEANEFIESETKEEFADILEVLDSIYQFKGFTQKEIERIKKKKFKARGGFTRKIILEKVTKYVKI